MSHNNGINHDDDFCGLEGNTGDPVTIGKFNWWLRMALRHHVIPTKELLQELNDLIIQHIQDDKLIQARIQGGITVLLWMVPILATLIPAVCILIIYLTHKAGLI